jgi:hypothetical protein
MAAVHRVVGFGIVGGFFLLLLWGGVAWLLRRDPTAWFWHLLALLQVALIVQVAVGVALLAMGRSQPLLHYAYGGVFPGLVLVAAHVVARGLEDRGEAWKVFTVASLFAFGLTLRALATGLGLP